MIFRRKPPDEPEVNVAALLEAEANYWHRLILLGQMNTLALAQATLSIIDFPEAVTDELRDELVSMIEQLQWGVARFEEYVVD